VERQGGGMINIEEVQKLRDSVIGSLNMAFDHLEQAVKGEETPDLPTEYTYPFTADTNIFIGKKPVAVLFGEERVEANNWRKVVAAIIARANADSLCHENLMYLRDKVAGKERILISGASDGMRRAHKVDEDMFVEVSYGTATLLYILRDRILAPARFDYFDIQIVIKS
jgi:hypothetical protein